jgi:RNA polymerase primary sigma factor
MRKTSTTNSPTRVPIRDDARHPDTADRIRRTLAYVPWVARRYRGGGLDFQELIAAGNLGLVQAALRFDPDRNVRFVTYADWWIRKAMIESVAVQRRPVRIPRNQHERLRELARVRAEWLGRHGSEPSAEQLAQTTGVSLSNLAELQRAARGPISLDQPTSPDGGHALNETIADAAAECPQESLIRRQLGAHLRRNVAGLSSREREVIELRFGLDRGETSTLREAAIRLGLSRERVRQIELRALLRLKQLL